ncbi:MAG: hypothetical protein LBD71_02490, partial [Treponema sp.]|nr:hypothetical protein [Treponema sp.]
EATRSFFMIFPYFATIFKICMGDACYIGVDLQAEGENYFTRYITFSEMPDTIICISPAKSRRIPCRIFTQGLSAEGGRHAEG